MTTTPPTPAKHLPTRLESHFGDRVVRCFHPRPADLNAMWRPHARRHPTKEAVVSGDERLNWGQLEDQALRAANGLRALGVGKGDRVALLMGNHSQFIVAFFAAQALGAVIVPLSTRDQTPGLTYILAHSGAKVLISDPDLQERWPLPADVPELRHRLLAGVPATHPQAFAALQSHAPLPELEPVVEEDLALIMYTSGTTGFPKGAMLTHLNVVHSVMHYQQALGLDENVRGAVVVPLSHVTGLVAIMLVALGLGGTLIVAAAFKAPDFLRLAARERMSYTILVPAMISLCLLQDDFAQHDLSAWTACGYGGAPMPPATIDRLGQQLPGLCLSNCYGATETTSPTTVMPAALTRDHLDSVGLPLPCAEVAVMDDEGRELPRGEIGELWLKGPMVVKGYWNNPQATAENIIGGHWRSGDVGRMDEHGFVYVMDRRKDMLNRGGYKIFSVEVENTLCQHADVLEAAVVAKPCPVLGERVHVFVHPREGRQIDTAALRAFCAERLSDYKVPESFTVSAAPLPRNANGKLLKRDMREQLLRELAATA